ncbi:MAG: hypothetical protein V3S30_03025 [Thermoanaerobaculia bacterium]
MARGKASTIEEYMAELPEERRDVVASVRDLIVANLTVEFGEEGFFTVTTPTASVIIADWPASLPGGGY